jgi:hypothetical protein
LKEKVAAPVKKSGNTAIGIYCADYVTPLSFPSPYLAEIFSVLLKKIMWRMDRQTHRHMSLTFVHFVHRTLHKLICDKNTIQNN